MWEQFSPAKNFISFHFSIISPIRSNLQTCQAFHNNLIFIKITPSSRIKNQPHGHFLWKTSSGTRREIAFWWMFVRRTTKTAGSWFGKHKADSGKLPATSGMKPGLVVRHRTETALAGSMQTKSGSFLRRAAFLIYTFSIKNQEKRLPLLPGSSKFPRCNSVLRNRLFFTSQTKKTRASIPSTSSA